MITTLTDAWHTVVPPRGDTHGPLSPLLLVLTVVTGLIDAFSYLVLGHVFVANMTGNVVFLAFALAGARGFSFAASLAALCAFLSGAATSGRLVVHLGSERRGRMLAVSSACEVVLVATAVVVGWTATPLGSGLPRYGLIILLGVTAGVQNGTARKLAVPDLTTTVLTSTLAGAAFESRAGGGPGSRVGRRGLAAAALFVGALVGATCVIHVGKPVGLLVALFLLVPVAAAAAKLSSARPAWEHVA